MAALVFSAAQRDHSKLQKPPSTPAPESGASAAATNAKRQERTGSRRDARVQFGAAQGGSAAEPGLGGFCQLVRVVRRF